MSKQNIRLPGLVRSLRNRHFKVISRHITPKKLANLALLYKNYLLGEEKSSGLPAIIKVEPSIACQLACTDCRGNATREDLKTRRETPFMSLDLYKKMIDELGPTLLEASLYDEGEPLMAPGIVEMVRYAANANVGTVISTNASFDPEKREIEAKLLGLADAGLDYIIFSIDGTTQQTHSAYRKGGNLSWTYENLRKFAAYVQKHNHPTRIEWQMIDFAETKEGEWQENRSEQAEARRMAHNLGVKFQLIANSLTNNQDRSYQRSNRCILPYISCAIDFRGNVSACISYDSETLTMGNLEGSPSFAALWNSPKYQELRRNHFNQNSCYTSENLRCLRCDRYKG